MNLSKEQVARYGRQLILPELGVAGQKKLSESSVLCVGAGGLGCSAAVYLAAAGVGRMGIVDADEVQLNNLHRQILHTTESVGQRKVDSAAKSLQALNPEISLQLYPERLNAANIQSIVSGYSLVVDGSDNFPTRYLVNDACVLNNIPYVYGGAIQFHGQLMLVHPKQSACFRCVFPEPPGEMPSCQEAGVLGATVGVIGSLMAFEALKYLAELGNGLTDRLTVFDGLKSRFRDVAVRRNTECSVCGDNPSITQLEKQTYSFCIPTYT